MKTGGLGDELSDKWKQNITVQLTFDRCLN